MTTPSKTKSCFKQLLSEISARWSSLSQIKISLSVKIVVALNFIGSIIKIPHLKYCPVCNV